MTSILKNLHIRLYEPKEIIVRELDECLEILFIFRGRYNVGYEINKKERYKR
jgi:hypothetical protein